MAVNNVFQMLAQQEIDRPQRDLQKMQMQAEQMKLKQMMAEQAYQQKARTDLAAMPQSTQTTQTLGSMGPQGQPFNPLVGPQMASMDPNAQGNKLSAMGLNVNPMERTEQKPLTLLEGFERQYQYHKSNGREAEAQKVLNDQLELTGKIAAVADNVYKMHGAEGLKAWHEQNPKWGSMLGDPSTIKVTADGILRALKNEDGTPSTTHFSTLDSDGKMKFVEIKPQPLQTFAPGVGIPDGKGGYTIPVPKEEKPEYKFRERVDGNRTVAEESQDNGRTWKKVSEGPRYKPAAAGGGGSGATGGAGGKPKPAKEGRTLPAGTLNDLNEASQMVKTLKEAQGVAAGVETGPAIGRLQSFGQKFGVASGDFTQLKQKIATVNNAMLKLRSGAAVTESEYQRFLQEMPTVNDDESVRDAKFANATQYMENLLEGKIATFAEGGYKVPSGVVGRSAVSPSQAKGRPAASTNRPAPKLSKAAKSVADRY